MLSLGSIQEPVLHTTSPSLRRPVWPKVYLGYFHARTDILKLHWRTVSVVTVIHADWDTVASCAKSFCSCSELKCTVKASSKHIVAECKTAAGNGYTWGHAKSFSKTECRHAHAHTYTRTLKHTALEGYRCYLFWAVDVLTPWLPVFLWEWCWGLFIYLIFIHCIECTNTNYCYMHNVDTVLMQIG